MTDDRAQTMLDELRTRGYDVRLRGTYGDDVVLGLWLREGSSARLRITLRGRRWEVASIGVPNLNLFLLLDGLPDSDVLRVLDTLAVPAARSHLPLEAPDQDRDPPSGALSCPEGDGTEGGRGQGAQDSGDPLWTGVLAAGGVWVGIAGMLVFAAWSEPTGWMDSGWALAGAFGSLLGGIGLSLLGVWSGFRRRAPG